MLPLLYEARLFLPSFLLDVLPVVVYASLALVRRSDPPAALTVALALVAALVAFWEDPPPRHDLFEPVAVLAAWSMSCALVAWLQPGPEVEPSPGRGLWRLGLAVGAALPGIWLGSNVHALLGLFLLFPLLLSSTRTSARLAVQLAVAGTLALVGCGLLWGHALAWQELQLQRVPIPWALLPAIAVGLVCAGRLWGPLALLCAMSLALCRELEKQDGLWAVRRFEWEGRSLPVCSTATTWTFYAGSVPALPGEKGQVLVEATAPWSKVPRRGDYEPARVIVRDPGGALGGCEVKPPILRERLVTVRALGADRVQLGTRIVPRAVESIAPLLNEALAACGTQQVALVEPEGSPPFQVQEVLELCSGNLKCSALPEDPGERCTWGEIGWVLECPGWQVCEVAPPIQRVRCPRGCEVIAAGEVTLTCDGRRCSLARSRRDTPLSCEAPCELRHPAPGP